MSRIISPEGLRPLPARPSLEFERKRAKKLVREGGGTIQLAEAQSKIAREYGFASWRKLRVYYKTWQTHERVGGRVIENESHSERSVQQVLREFQNRKIRASQPPDVIGTGASISAFVPRFYGLSDEEIFSSTLTEAEAQLVVARRARYATYATLISEAKAFRTIEQSRLEVMPSRESPRDDRVVMFSDIFQGIDDIDRITRLFNDKARLVCMSDPYQPLAFMDWRYALRAIHALPHATTIIEWVRSLDDDVRGCLTGALMGSGLFGVTTDEIALLLQLGADPHATSRSGCTVVEHAAVRYCNAEALDMIARLAKPRKSFWLAAALGDVDTMLTFVNAKGVPTEAARNDRPDLSILTAIFPATRPDAPDHDILWEAFLAAALNGRTECMQALLDRGFPIDHAPVWFNTLHISIDRCVTRTVTFLLDRGANPRHRAWPDQPSPLDIASVNATSTPLDSDRQAIYGMVLRAAAPLFPAAGK